QPRRQPQHDDDGAGVDQRQLDRVGRALLALLEEEADGDRDHREDARRQERQEAERGRRQQEAGQVGAGQFGPGRRRGWGGRYGGSWSWPANFPGPSALSNWNSLTVLSASDPSACLVG